MYPVINPDSKRWFLIVVIYLYKGQAPGLRTARVLANLPTFLPVLQQRLMRVARAGSGATPTWKLFRINSLTYLFYVNILYNI